MTTKVYGHADNGAKRAGALRRKTLTLLGSLLLVSWGSGQAVLGQAPPSAEKRYISKSVLTLPIVIDPRVQPSLREVQLWVREGAGARWHFDSRADPGQKEFRFRAGADGEYWFSIVSVDKAGRSTPADMTNEQPGVIVIIDTQAPQVELRTVPSSDEATLVQCVIRDANPDPARVKFEFQTGDQVWRPLDSVPDHPDTYRIPPQAVVTGKVRAHVTDKAGNAAECEANLASAVAAVPAPAKTGLAAGSPSVGAPVAPMLPVPEHSAPVAHARHDEPVEGPARLAPTVVRTTHEVHKSAKACDVPELPAASASAARHEAPETLAAASARQVVNTRRVFLNYKIDQTGPSGVGRVEIWMTRDRGQTWEHIGDDDDRVSPAEVQLPGEGLFGITLAVSNGRGFGAAPPGAGDAPDWWIEVDQTRPVAELVSVEPSAGNEPGAMIITWKARDKNLGPAPIDLYWSAGREGPWAPIAKGIRNEQQHRWNVPQEAGGQAYVKLVVTDLAKNVAECVTEAPVSIDDLSRPRIRVVGVTTSAPKGRARHGDE